MKNQINHGTGRVFEYMNYRVFRTLTVAAKLFDAYIVEKMLNGENSCETAIAYNHYQSKISEAVERFRATKMSANDWHDLCLFTLGHIIR